MNIAYILADPGIGVFGSKGASVHVQEMIRALRHHGHTVTVFCVRRGEKDGTELIPEDLLDLEVIDVPRPRGRGAEREQALRGVSDDLVAAVQAREFDLVYERYALFSDAGVRIGLPLILEVNAPLIEEQAIHRSLTDVATAHRLSVAMFEAAELVSCVSGPVADWVHGLTPQARTAVIPNGVNTARFLPAEPGAGELTVGFVGTLKPWHGTGILLDAVARATHPWRLEFCGTGPEQEALELQAAQLGIAHRVRFHGAVAPADVPQVLAGWDAACAPYPQADGHYFSPLKVYEYMAAGLPVIASAVGELPALLCGRGLLVEPGDTGQLSRALDRLAAEPALRAELGAAASGHVDKHHTWNQRCGDLLAQLPVTVRS
ncbi:glycosyltransferase family 4 protein [Corynebacterium sp. YIM 101645]|uniref:Glycosyltransferase family 4 protein n=1 Tax=Corynebacterium lemuris TaxID=1859292 RepID=A0ABT2FZQ4_9CORY|nr:glycosyltransferase family 4 protein [Corynebacterium lemuris]MCS5480734.1 glycosyltransferase family 4 protein [Corynebacterium lemuris]